MLHLAFPTQALTARFYPDVPDPFAGLKAGLNI